MEIRPATPRDVPAVLPMVEKVCAFHEQLDPAKYGFLPDPASMYEGWLRKQATNPRSVFLVADAGHIDDADDAGHDADEDEDEDDEDEDDDGGDGGHPGPRRIVGFLIGTEMSEIPIYRLDTYGFIHDLWVDDRYRHEGLGRQLVTLAVERFREMGLAQVRLDTAAGNEPARNLFRACGFRPSIVEMLIRIDEDGGGEPRRTRKARRKS